jgi:plastocyanin
MQDESSPNPQVPVEKKLDKKIKILSLIIICGVILLSFLIITGFTAKKHTLTNQPNQINQQNSSVPSGQVQAVQPLPQINTVTLTKNGFSPEKVTIRKGAAAKWINNSGTDNASVNSDDYPTNRRFPELNLGKISNGSAVAHIFTTAGTYTYHNQFNPKQKGIIVVE